MPLNDSISCISCQATFPGRSSPDRSRLVGSPRLLVRASGGVRVFSLTGVTITSGLVSHQKDVRGDDGNLLKANQLRNTVSLNALRSFIMMEIR